MKTENVNKYLQKIYVVMSSDHAWGKGWTLEEAAQNCWKAGASKTAKAVIVVNIKPRGVEGDKQHLWDNTWVDDMGWIHYPTYGNENPELENIGLGESITVGAVNRLSALFPKKR